MREDGLDWPDPDRGSGPGSSTSHDHAVPGSLLDRAVLGVFTARRQPRPLEEVGRTLDETRAAVAFYEEQGWLGDPALFFPAPPAPTGVRANRRRAAGLTFDHLTFASGYEPHPREPGRERWLAHAPNRTAHAWILRHDRPRPWLVCVHGAGVGYPRAEFAGFRAAWLHRELGLNLAFPVLPLHGPRRDRPGLSPGFPADDPLDTVHGIAEAVWDVRRLVRWVATEAPAAVGLFGLSLGGCTSALVAGVEDGLACVIAGIPLVDVAAVTTENAPLKFTSRSDYRALVELAPALYRVVSPLALTPRLPVDRRFIFGGLADRLVPPGTQVERLWEHWGRPRMCWFAGGHVGYLRSARVRAFTQEALARSGLIDDDWTQWPPPPRRSPTSGAHRQRNR
jgi:hypothetical protein